jgi:hypothetical protein
VWEVNWTGIGAPVMLTLVPLRHCYDTTAISVGDLIVALILSILAQYFGILQCRAKEAADSATD